MLYDHATITGYCELIEGKMKNEKIVTTLNRLRQRYGTKPWNWHTRQKKPFHVLVGTILSQRTRDSQTDAAAQNLFERFATPDELANAPLKEIEKLIRNVNYHKTKAKRIREIAKIIAERFNGKVPQDIKLLMSLPGVGRKTANCVLLYGFGKPVLPVDTHVHRIANRLGWIKTKTPEETEQALKKIITPDWIPFVNDLFVKHGQTLCKPNRPYCDRCPIADLCQFNH